jgi:hypothetical protein
MDGLMQNKKAAQKKPIGIRLPAFRFSPNSPSFLCFIQRAAFAKTV